MNEWMSKALKFACEKTTEKQLTHHSLQTRKQDANAFRCSTQIPALAALLLAPFLSSLAHLKLKSVGPDDPMDDDSVACLDPKQRCWNSHERFSHHAEGQL